MVDGSFWEHLDQLVAESHIVIEVSKGGYKGDSELVSPVDYGYLKGTSSMDGSGIDIFVGSDPGRRIDSIICTIDLVKRDSEIKALIGCTEEEKYAIMQLYEAYPRMRGLLIRRN
jgi:inorganic pyrophosphatase